MYFVLKFRITDISTIKTEIYVIRGIHQETHYFRRELFLDHSYFATRSTICQVTTLFYNRL